MGVLAVSGSVVFVAMQIHKRVVSSFMKKMEYEIKNPTGAMKLEVVKKKVRFADEKADVVVAEKSQAVAFRRNHDQNFESLPLNWQVLYKEILKHRSHRG